MLKSELFILSHSPTTTPVTFDIVWSVVGAPWTLHMQIEQSEHQWHQGRIWLGSEASFHHFQTLCLQQSRLYLGKKKVSPHIESPGLFRKTLPVSQALEHKTQVKLVTNKFWMNYWWALEASFLLSPSELPAFEPWLWQHAQGLKNKDSNTYRNSNPHSTIKRKNSVPACV